MSKGPVRKHIFFTCKTCNTETSLTFQDQFIAEKDPNQCSACYFTNIARRAVGKPPLQLHMQKPSRPCIRCGGSFVSEGIHHRMCVACRYAVSQHTERRKPIGRGNWYISIPSLKWHTYIPRSCHPRLAL